MSPPCEVRADERDKPVHFWKLLTEYMELYLLPLGWMKSEGALDEQYPLLIHFLPVQLYNWVAH